MSNLPIPERIGRYRVDHELGRGGMGVVYAAYDDQLERMVAIKTVSTASADERARKRLRREARAAARIQHPNVCHLYEIDENDGELYLAMELLEGESLDDRLRRGALPIPEAVEISLQLLSALQILHAAGLVHRDLKPSNIFLTPHGVKVLDFGLAQTAHSALLLSQESTETQLTQAGTIVGTPPYMAPEQFQGQQTDARTDLFALGAVIFEMLMGTRAFPGESALEVYHKTLHEQAPSLGGSPAAAALDKIVRRALAKNPEDRFPGAAEMAAAIGTVPMADDSDEAQAYSVARLIVMPFRVLRPDADTDFLGFGIPDAVSSALTGIESLVVRSSATAARFEADSLEFERIAEEADVDVVLTGSLLRAGDQIRVTTQLVEVPAGTILWSHTPTVTMRDVFELQDRIVEHIVESLSLSLTTREHRRLKTDVPASPTAYEFFLRGNQQVLPQGASTENLSLGRDLFQRCVEEDPRYAPAWARLGRCHWLIGKHGENLEQNTRLAEECFERAFQLNPDLALAHNLYAFIEIDQGRALDAMIRLIERAAAGSTQPELYASLVTACRYCGLIEASVAAHERAEQLDRNIITSVDHSYFHSGDYERALEYVQRQFYGITPIAHRTAVAWNLYFEQGRTDEAILLRKELNQERLMETWRLLGTCELALYEGRRQDCIDAAIRGVAQVQDAEGIRWMSRILAFLGEREMALDGYNRAFDRGLNLYADFTRQDFFLDPIRGAPGFEDLLCRSEVRYDKAVSAFKAAGGEKVLGVAVLRRDTLEES